MGGTPISDLNLSDEEIIKRAWDTYWERGEIPPWIAEHFSEEELVEMRKKLKKNLEEKEKAPIFRE
ncbi:MAG: hypothetical protein Q7J16_00535 [Candidatus Cloacimonadales bacterium]|nr:hypothetical protein [Candidatus Cloacimonadales bacterium]